MKVLNTIFIANKTFINVKYVKLSTFYNKNKIIYFIIGSLSLSLKYYKALLRRIIEIANKN